MNMLEKPWYVYALCDPDTEEPFYIGKGTQDRMKQQSQSSRNQATLYRIHCIQAAGKQVLRKKLAEFELEEDAYLYEWAMINVYNEQITNIRDNATRRAKKPAFPIGCSIHLFSEVEQTRYINAALNQLDIQPIKGYVTEEEATMILSWRAETEQGDARHYQAITKFPRYALHRLFWMPLSLFQYDNRTGLQLAAIQRSDHQHIRARPAKKGA